MAIAKAIVELHGGRIMATSAGAGRGSEFSISLPRMLAVPRYTPEPVAESFEEARSRRVLVVDDNLDLVETVAELISCVGHDVTIAYDGLEAWRKLAHEQFEVAVLDIGLPGLSGYELVERIRADDRLRSMHVIALTGYGGADARDTAMTAGFVLTPSVLPRLRLLGNYWKITTDHRVTFLHFTSLLANEESFQDRVQRDAPTQADIAAGLPGRLLQLVEAPR